MDFVYLILTTDQAQIESVPVLQAVLSPMTSPSLVAGGTTILKNKSLYTVLHVLFKNIIIKRGLFFLKQNFFTALQSWTCRIGIQRTSKGMNNYFL